MKMIFSFLMLLGSGMWCPFPSAYQDSGNFENTALQVVKAFQEKDALTLNGLIPEGNALTVVYRPGVFDYYGLAEKINFEQPVPSYLPVFDFSVDLHLQYESLPTYDCMEESWSKSGIFCDTTQVNRLLSTTAENINKYELNHIPDEVIQSFRELENASRRVVVADGENSGLVFYLTQIDGKWRFTLLDLVSSDCSS